MPAYARKTTIEDQFGARRGPDNTILCNRCNCNLADQASNPKGTVYLLYVDKNHVKTNIPHDVYCEACLNSDYPKAKIV